MLKKTRFIIALLICSLNLNAQKANINNDLSFQGFNPCSWEWLANKTNCKISLEKPSSQETLPALRLIYDSQRKIAPEFPVVEMKFCLFKPVILPQSKNKKIDVTLTLKNLTTTDLLFSVSGVDRNEKITFTKTLNVNQTTGWESKSISSVAPGTKAIYIKMQFSGTADPAQTVWLKDIKIKTDGKDLDEIKDDLHQADNQLNARKITPLSHDEKFDLTGNIADIKRNRIIGLGENTHGSKTICLARYQFLKNLILKENCRLILLEQPFDHVSLFDLYVQGKIPENAEKVYGYAKLTFNYEPELDFLKWLRNYNMSATRKVHLLGIDNAGSAENSIIMMDYHLELLGPEKGKFYVKNIYDGKIKELIAYTKNDSTMYQLLGNENFPYYRYLLSCKFSKNFEEMAFNRDSLMFKRVKFLDSLFTTGNEKIAILAHANHLQKIQGFGKDGAFSTLGSLLSEKYTNSYFAIDFCFGSGSFTQDSCATPVNIAKETLKTLPENSFEYAAMKTGSDYFYFPSGRLNDRIFTTAMITRMSQNQNHFKFVSLKSRFDGIVFLNKSEGFDYLTRSPFLHSILFWDNERYKINRVIFGEFKI